ncbi:MAG: DUF2953 domain-containing protein [Candidatus Zixiibacteriota bacterium]|nr:MAG: DUF2953 domain-containing protein [candidate division Zixibacteria bacterium]
MTTLLAVAIGIVAVLTLICFLAPIRLQLSFDDRRRSVALSWLVINLEGNLKERAFQLGLFNQRIITKRFKKSDREVRKTKKTRPRAKAKIKDTKKKSKLSMHDLWSKKELVLRVIRIAFRFFVDLLGTIRWDKLSLELDVATPDPALTGILYGQLCAAKYPASHFFPSARIELHPDFVSQLPRGSGETAFSVRPVNVVVSASKMFFALPKIQMVKALIEIKRR